MITNIVIKRSVHWRPRQQLHTRNLLRDKLRFASHFHPMHSENILGGIDTHGDNADDFPMLTIQMKTTPSIQTLSKPFAATSPRLRDGKSLSFVRPPTMVRQLTFVTLGVLLVLAGCAANQQWINATPEQRKIMFENGWNSAIGKRFIPYETTILSVTDTQNGKREYIIKQNSECKIALLIENESSILLSWRYLSEQAKCAAYYYTPGA